MSVAWNGQKNRLLIGLLTFCLGLSSCRLWRPAPEEILDLKPLEFSLVRLDNLRLLGTPLKNKKRLQDFSISQSYELSEAFAKGHLPLEFDLWVSIYNPNNGFDEQPKTDLSIEKMKWTVFLDDKKTARGRWRGEEILLPGIEKKALVPIKVYINLARHFKEEGYEYVFKKILSLDPRQDQSWYLIRLDFRYELHTPWGPEDFETQVRREPSV